MRSVNAYEHSSVSGKIAMNVSNIIRIISLLVCIFAFTIAEFTQAIERENVFVCQEVERKVSEQVKISKAAKPFARDDECYLYFYSGGDWFSIHAKKFESEEESKKEFSFEFDVLALDETYPESVKHLKLHNFWDEAKGFNREPDPDRFIMLRHHSVVLTLISSNYELLEKIEPVLRTIKFGGKSNLSIQ